MSKQSEAKARQNYQEKPRLKLCSNCLFFRFEKKTVGNGFGDLWTEEKKIRCGKGGFKNKKTASCDSHEFKNQTTEVEVDNDPEA